MNTLEKINDKIAACKAANPHIIEKNFADDKANWVYKALLEIRMLKSESEEKSQADKAVILKLKGIFEEEFKNRVTREQASNYFNFGRTSRCKISGLRTLKYYSLCDAVEACFPIRSVVEQLRGGKRYQAVESALLAAVILNATKDSSDFTEYNEENWMGKFQENYPELYAEAQERILADKVCQEEFEKILKDLFPFHSRETAENLLNYLG